MTSDARGSSHPERPVLLSVAFPYAPVGPRAVGGAEVVLSLLEASLPGMGFTSVVVAHAESAPTGRLYGTAVPTGAITDAVRAEVEGRQQANIDRALAEHPVALVHLHGLDFHRYRIPEHIPVLVTLHLPPGWYPEEIWSLPSNYHLLCVSETQRSACPAHVRERIAVIGNGVPLPDIATLRTEGRYAVMLARICPEKNLHTGLDAARLAGMPVMLGGEVFAYEAHQRYFRDEIAPRLSSVNAEHQGRAAGGDARPIARFLGGVSGEAKARLLARAACLLLPSVAPETSSMVAMEALAAGVPVIAMASGAVPEIIDDGRTGFLIRELGNAAEAMAEAIRRLPQLDRRDCRSAAEARFTLPRMLGQYEELYGALLRSAPESAPKPKLDSVSSDRVTSSSRPFTVEHLTQGSDLEALRGAWECLWKADTQATPFQHPAWLLPWWHQFGPEGNLHALAMRDAAGELRGLLPMYTYQPRESDDRQLLFLGAGTTDLLDGLFHPDADRDRLAQEGLEYISRDMNDWRSLSLNQLRPGSPMLAAGATLGTGITECEPCFTISARGMLPAKIRANAGRYRRRAEERGALMCSVANTTEEAIVAFEHLVQLHGERWKERGEAGVLSDPRVLAHHRQALPLLLEAGLLRMFSLVLGEETIAVLYAFADPQSRPSGNLYLYLIGIAPEQAVLSPGTLLLHAAWNYAVSQGFDKVNLLRGGEHYKQLWGAQPEPTFALRVQR